MEDKPETAAPLIPNVIYARAYDGRKDKAGTWSAYEQPHSKWGPTGKAKSEHYRVKYLRADTVVTQLPMPSWIVLSETVDRLKKELNTVKAEYDTEHTCSEENRYWRGVRIGLETSIAILEETLSRHEHWKDTP